MRAPVSTVVALGLGLLLAGCVSSEPEGYAARARAETDALARTTLPALVTGDIRLNPGRSAFVSCSIGGWRYRGDVDLFGEVDAEMVTAAMVAADLEVERRPDGSVIGRRGRLSMLLGQAAGPAGRAFRHLSFSQQCAHYGDADTAYAESAEPGDYAAYVSPDQLYDPTR